MKRPNVAIELLKLFAVMVIGWILWLMIFSATITPEDANMTIEPFRGASMLFGVLTGLVVAVGLKYNLVHRAYQKTRASFSNIQVL